MVKKRFTRKQKRLPTFMSLTVTSAKKKLQGLSPAILIPYRDNPTKERSVQLKQFVDHFSKAPWNAFHVYIIEQSEDNRKFNRGALLNVGAHLAKKHSHLILHDIDLLPDTSILPYYTMFPDHPIHIGWAWTAKYNYLTFLGGILSVSAKDFQQINGYPNQFWGWGGEDDVLHNRFIHAKIPIYRPIVRTGITELPHVHSGNNPDLVNPRKKEMVAMNRGKDGVHQTQWKELHKESLASHIKKYTVELE